MTGRTGSRYPLPTTWPRDSLPWGPCATQPLPVTAGGSKEDPGAAAVTGLAEQPEGPRAEGLGNGFAQRVLCHSRDQQMLSARASCSGELIPDRFHPKYLAALVSPMARFLPN